MYVLPLLALVAGVSLMVASADPVVDQSRHAYAHFVVTGAVSPIETFRASFGGFFPCGQHPVVFALASYGCEASDLPLGVAGGIVLTRRGVCTVVQKALVAQAAGALAVVVINNEPGLVHFGAGNVTTPFPILIPVALIPNMSWPLMAHLANMQAEVTAAFAPARDRCATITQTLLTWEETVIEVPALTDSANAALAVDGSTHSSVVAETGTPAGKAVNAPSCSGSSCEAAVGAHGAMPAIAQAAATARVASNATLATVATPAARVNHTLLSYDITTLPTQAAVTSAVIEESTRGQVAGDSGLLSQVARLRIHMHPATQAQHHHQRNHTDSAARSVNRHTGAGIDEVADLKTDTAVYLDVEAVAALFSGPLVAQSVSIMIPHQVDGCSPYSNTGAQEADHTEYNSTATGNVSPAAHSSNDSSASGKVSPADDPAAAASDPSATGSRATATPPFFVVVLRGNCPMILKARFAAAAGASGIIIVNQPIDTAAAATNSSTHSNSTSSKDGSATGTEHNVTTNKPRATVHSVGIVQAVGDLSTEGAPLLIPTIMISARYWQDMLHIATATAQSSATTIAIANAIAPADVRANISNTTITTQLLTVFSASLHPTPARGDAWLSLAALEGSPTSPWPSDPFHRAQLMGELLAAHHPASHLGDADRFAHLEALAAAGGVGEELAQSLATAVWRDGRYSAGVHAGGGTRPLALSHTHAGSAFLGQYLPATDYTEAVSNSMMYCRSEGGMHYTVDRHSVDVLSPFSPHKKLAELLLTQACLEKLAIENGAVIGAYMALVRGETPREEWPRVAASLFRPFRWPPAASETAAREYIELAASMGVMQATAASVSVRDLVRDTQHGSGSDRGSQ